MAEFKKGQRVKVEFEGVISYVFTNGSRASVKDANGSVSNVNTGCVTVLDPPGWPPQVGDIWEAGGEWFGSKLPSSGDLVLTGENRRFLYPDDFKALNPVLVRRRGQ